MSLEDDLGCRHPGMGTEHAPFHSFEALCRACGRKWYLRGCSDYRNKHESGPPIDGVTHLPLYVMSCPCGAVADGILPAHAYRDTVVATAA